MMVGRHEAAAAEVGESYDVLSVVADKLNAQQTAKRAANTLMILQNQNMLQKKTSAIIENRRNKTNAKKTCCKYQKH